MQSKESKKRKVSSIVITIVVIIVIIAVGLLILWQTGYLSAIKTAKQIQEQKEETGLTKEDTKILNQLKEIIDLPEDILPLMAVVNDAELLQAEQPGFFAKAKNGDRVIVYPDIAILYDYEANRICIIGQ